MHVSNVSKNVSIIERVINVCNILEIYLIWIMHFLITKCIIFRIFLFVLGFRRKANDKFGVKRFKKDSCIFNAFCHEHA